MTGSRSDIWAGRFVFAFGIMLFEGIEEDNLVRGTRGPRNHG